MHPHPQIQIIHVHYWYIVIGVNISCVDLLSLFYGKYVCWDIIGKIFLVLCAEKWPHSDGTTRSDNSESNFTILQTISMGVRKT